MTELESMLGTISGTHPKYDEPLQRQRYAEGQEFKPHTDYFNSGGHNYEKFCSVSGQPTWTFMIYLNAVEAGGGARFKAIDKIFKPQAEKLLCWNNRHRDGRIHPKTLHHGMKLRKGTKYVLTKWYRDREWE